MRVQVAQSIARAREVGEVDAGVLLIGQTAGLIDSIEPAGDLVERIVREAEQHLARASATVLTPA
jgi:enoyl-[acyl-carrier protein] reductase II